MLKKVTIPPDIRALIVRELADALVLDYQQDTDVMVISAEKKDHNFDPRADKIVVTK